MKSNIVSKDDSLNSWFLTILISFPVINYYIAAIYWSIGLDNPFAEFIYAFVYAIGIFSILRRFDVYKAVVLVIVALLLAYSLIVTPQAKSAYMGPPFVRSSLVQLLFIYLPIFLLASDKKFDFEKSLSTLSYVSIVPVFLMLVAFVLQVYITGLGLQEYMTFAYTALPLTMVLMYYSWSTRKRLFGKSISLLAFFSLLFGGCRGALFTLLLFIVLCIVLYSKKSIGKYIAIIGAAIVVLNLSSIMSSLGGELQSLGIESRIFNFISDGTIAESDSRLLVYNKALSIIDVYGHGIYSDRFLLEHVDDATYCHNWILEFLVDYGLLIGGILVILVIMKLIKIMHNTSSESQPSRKFLVFFSISMLGAKFMLSQSYLNSPEPALVFGWLLFLTRNNVQYGFKKFNS